MSEKLETLEPKETLDFDKEELAKNPSEGTAESPEEERKKAIGEVGVMDAPNGGRAAWFVVLGSFCVSVEMMYELF